MIKNKIKKIFHFFFFFFMNKNAANNQSQFYFTAKNILKFSAIIFVITYFLNLSAVNTALDFQTYHSLKTESSINPHRETVKKLFKVLEPTKTYVTNICTLSKDDFYERHCIVVYQNKNETTYRRASFKMFYKNRKENYLIQQE